MIKDKAPISAGPYYHMSPPQISESGFDSSSPRMGMAGINPHEMVKYETGQQRIRKGILDPLNTAGTIEYNACRAEHARDAVALMNNCEFTYKAAVDKSIDFIRARIHQTGSEEVRVLGEALIERLMHVREAPGYPVHECKRRMAFMQYAQGEGLNDFCKKVLYWEEVENSRGRLRR